MLAYEYQIVNAEKEKENLVVKWGNRSIHIKRIIAEFTSETREERGTWTVIFKIFKGETNKKLYQARITYPPNIQKCGRKWINYLKDTNYKN